MTEPKPFQLNPDDFKTGNLFLDGAVKSAVKKANTVDLNHDGKADISQIAAVVMGALPLLVALNDAVDFEAAAKALAEKPFVKDKEVFKHAILQLGKLAEQAGAAIAPHHK